MQPPNTKYKMMQELSIETKKIKTAVKTADALAKKKANAAEKKAVKEAKATSEKKKLETEDTGKKFEMSICLAYGIPYDGKFKYSMDDSEKLKHRLSKLVELFPMCTHTAKKGARYDFTSLVDEKVHLSAKSSKKFKAKVAPQVIGQAQPTKFCEILEIPYTTIPVLKKYIQKNILSILPILVSYTFDCAIIYYIEKLSLLKFIRLIKPIDWNLYTYEWTRSWDCWKNGSTLKIIKNGEKKSLLEFQFHSASRTNMAVRWYFDKFLDIFKDHLSITDM